MNPFFGCLSGQLFYLFSYEKVIVMICYNSAKDVPHFCKWGLGQITGGEHISRLVEMPQRKVCLWQTLIEGIIMDI